MRSGSLAGLLQMSPEGVSASEELARSYTEEAVETLAELMRTGVPDSVRG
jgi:hypothetical protein